MQQITHFYAADYIFLSSLPGPCKAVPTGNPGDSSNMKEVPDFHCRIVLPIQVLPMKYLYLLLSVFVFLIMPSMSFSREDTDEIKAAAEKLYPEAVRVRRILHQNPEPGNREEKTAAFIAEYLRDLGLEVTTGIARHGVKAVLRGGRSGPVIGLRADMDALPIDEENDVPCRSRTRGVMHACGHDLHMTNVLIAARIAAQMRDRVPGTLVFIFQPCEEGPPQGEEGGADLMIREGVLENPHVDAMIGLHVTALLETGQIGIREGPITANTDFFYLDILGKSAHGALPHLGIDGIYVSSLAILQFQGILSRLKDPLEPAVLTVGTIEGGVRRNVIADRVHMEGTVRTFSKETQDLIREKMEAVLLSLKGQYGIEYKFNYVAETPFVNNDPHLFGLIGPALARVVEKKDIIISPAQTIGDDFAFYSQKVPGFFFFLGVGNKAKGYTSNLHTSTFMGDEESLKLGPRLFMEIALELGNTFKPGVRHYESESGNLPPVFSFCQFWSLSF